MESQVRLLQKDLKTLASSRCDTWNRRARLDLQERVTEGLAALEEASDVEALLVESIGKQ